MKWYVYTFSENDPGKWFHYEENAKAYVEELKRNGHFPMVEEIYLSNRERFNTRFADTLKNDPFVEHIRVPFNVIPF